jgi:hypothetical protein
MDKKNELNRLEVLCNIIEVIDQANKKIETLRFTLDRCGGLPTISLSLKNRIDTLNQVILRLNKCYYKKLMEQI